MKQLYVLALLLVLAVGRVAAQESAGSLNMTLYGWMNPTDTAGEHAAIWGYAAPDGREYALFCSQIGLFIIDVTEQPVRQVAFIPGLRSTWREVKVYKNYAYIATEADGGGLQIVDLANLPHSATLVNTDLTNFRRAHTLFIRDHYLYAMGTQAEAGANGGALIMDLEPDPVHPVRVGAVSPYYYHDAWVRNDTLLGAAIYGQGCDIYDIHDKANPKHLATITYSFSGTHNAEMTSDGNYAVTSDEIGLTLKTMKVWDIRDLDNITMVAEFSPDPVSTVHNVHVRGRYVLAAWYTAGVRILDMIDPPHPREVGYYDTYPSPNGGFGGVWEVYGFFPSGKIIASDRNTGLYVFQFNGATAGSVSGFVRDAATNAPLAGVSIRIPETGQTITSDAAGRYYAGGANGSQVTLITSEFRYAGSSETITYDGDKQKDILLAPLPFVSAIVMAKDEGGAAVDHFAYAVTPYYISATTPNSSAQVQLPRDSTYMLEIGKWGYKTQRVPIRITQDQEPVNVTLHPGYSDDATLDLGWSFESQGDNATNGRWTRIVPYQTYSGTGWFYPETEPGGDRNGYVFQTGAPPLRRPINDGDVANGYTTLTTPVMNMADMPNPTISFHRWFVHYFEDTLRDSLIIQISNDDGGSWTTAYSETRLPTSAEWRQVVITPKDFLGLTDRMKMRFRVSDVSGKASIFSGIDNFSVDPGISSGAPDERSGERAGMMLSVAPNPVQASGSVALRLPASQRHLTLEVFDAQGRRQTLLHDGALTAGEHSFPLPGALTSGSYLIRATGDGGVISNAMFQVMK